MTWGVAPTDPGKSIRWIGSEATAFTNTLDANRGLTPSGLVISTVICLLSTVTAIGPPRGPTFPARSMARAVSACGPSPSAFVLYATVNDGSKALPITPPPAHTPHL